MYISLNFFKVIIKAFKTGIFWKRYSIMCPVFKKFILVAMLLIEAYCDPCEDHQQVLISQNNANNDLKFHLKVLILVYLVSNQLLVVDHLNKTYLPCKYFVY